MTQHSLAEIAVGRAPYQKAWFSPGRRYALVLTAVEAANSQWVESGTLYVVAGERPIAQFGEWLWTIDKAEWDGDERVTLYMRRFPGDAPGLVLAVDISAATAAPAGGGETVPLAGIGDWLEAWYAARRGGR